MVCREGKEVGVCEMEGDSMAMMRQRGNEVDVEVEGLGRRWGLENVSEMGR